MTDWVVAYFREIWILVFEAAPFLLIGFAAAGLIKVFLRQERIYRHLGGNNLGSVFRASLWGVPLPLCSCSVIPTAVSLKEAGASKGATASFMISTPETGVDSVSVTYALLDPIMTVVRPIAAFLTAIATGTIVTWFERQGWGRDGEMDASKSPQAASRGEATAGGREGSCKNLVCAAGDRADDESEREATLAERLLEAIVYAYKTLLDDLTPWFVLGFLISGLIAVLVPDGFFTESIPRGWTTSLLMLVVGTPMYICATASTPVAAALVAKGLDPGAALVFLLVGPATNVTTVLVISRFLGRRVLAVYLPCIAGVALLMGVVTNGMYESLGLDLSAVVAGSRDAEPGIVKIVSAVVFLLLLLGSMARLTLDSTWMGRARDLQK